MINCNITKKQAKLLIPRLTEFNCDITLRGFKQGIRKIHLMDDTNIICQGFSSKKQTLKSFLDSIKMYFPTKGQTIVKNGRTLFLFIYKERIDFFIWGNKKDLLKNRNKVKIFIKKINQ